jgi:hypothetical protein
VKDVQLGGTRLPTWALASTEASHLPFPPHTNSMSQNDTQKNYCTLNIQTHAHLGDLYAVVAEALVEALLALLNGHGGPRHQRGLLKEDALPPAGARAQRHGIQERRHLQLCVHV